MKQAFKRPEPNIELVKARLQKRLNKYEHQLTDEEKMLIAIFQLKRED